MKIKKAFAVFSLLLGVSVMKYAGERLTQARQMYQEGDAAYRNMSMAVRGRRAAEYAARFGTDGQELIEAIPLSAEMGVFVPDIGIDFNALRRINADAAAWLYCPDTVIDYPIMRADDYAYYLSHLPDGAPNANGSLFIDYNCAHNFGDPLTVVYGHNMRSGSMFGGLKGYKEQSFYDEYPYMYLYTERRNYRIELLYGCVIDAGQWRERAFMYAENVGALLVYAAGETTFTSGASYAVGDRVVALSTCSYEFEDARYVVIGVLREEH